MAITNSKKRTHPTLFKSQKKRCDGKEKRKQEDGKEEQNNNI